MSDPKFVVNGVHWTDADERHLIALWNIGMSMTEVGNAMGRSRSAVAGKLGRLHLATRRDKAPRQNTKEKIARKRRKMPNAVHKPLTLAEFEAIPTCEPVEYLKLEPHHCRALLPDRGSDGLLLSCGRPKFRPSTGTSSYCPIHFRLYATPAALERILHGQAG